MKDLVQFAVDTAKLLRVSYADARVVYHKTQNIIVRNGEVKGLEQAEDIGIGVRVITDGAWGFASTDRLTKAGITKTVKRAIELAKSSALLKAKDVALSEEPTYIAEWQSPYQKDPFEVSAEEKIDYMMSVDEAIRGVRGITLSEVGFNFMLEEKFFANSEGSLIHQKRLRTGAGFIAGAFKDGEYQQRSYPTSFGGKFELKGYELIEELKLLEHAVPYAEEAVALLSAPLCPCSNSELDLILGSDQLALQIHESVGHPVELDRVLGAEANFAGTSFLTVDKLGNFRYGSQQMNIVADARLEHGASLGCFGYDDEGVEAQCVDIVKEGIFVGYLTSREAALEINKRRSGGAMRAMSWNRIPLIRMTQVSLLPGSWELDELISDTKHGIFMQTNKSWSIDDRRLNFQFGCEVGWEIKDGKKIRMVKNPTYSGITPIFWNSLDAVCSKEYWQLWGLPNCGKGQPPQIMEVAHGAAPARFRKVNIGAAALGQ